MISSKILDQLRTARKPCVLTVQAFADRFSELNQWASWLQGHEANPILTEAQEKQGLHDSMPQVWCTKYSEMHGNLMLTCVRRLLNISMNARKILQLAKSKTGANKLPRSASMLRAIIIRVKKVNLSPKDRQSRLLTTPRIIAMQIQTNSVPSIRIMIINGRTASKILRTPIVGLQRKQRKQKQNNLLRMTP